MCTAGFVLTAVGRVHELFPPLNVVRPAIVTGLLSIFLFVLDTQSARRWKWISAGPTPWLLALFGWMVVGIPTALVPGHSFEFALTLFSKTVVMSIVLAAAIRGPRDVERIAAMYFWSAALYAAVVLVKFDVGDGADWRLGHLYYYDANDFATFAVASMPIGVYFVQRSRTLFRRVLPILALIVISAAFVRSGSRGGFLALIVTVLFIVGGLNAISIGKRIAAVAVVAAVLFIAASDRYWTRMGSIVSDTDYNQTEETGRLQVWQRGISYVLGYPIFGVGADNFAAAEGMISPLASRQQYGRGVKWNAPHNTFLQVAAETGLPGLVFFLLMLGSAFRVLRPARRPRGYPVPPPVSPGVKQAIRAGLLGFMVGSFFLSLAYLEALYILIALAIAINKIERRSRVATPTPVPVQ